MEHNFERKQVYSQNTIDKMFCAIITRAYELRVTGKESGFLEFEGLLKDALAADRYFQIKQTIN